LSVWVGLAVVAAIATRGALKDPSHAA